MRLLVVSHTRHHRRGDQLVGWGATVRELDHLAGLVDELVHVAPLHTGPAPTEALPYAAANVRLVPLAPSGAEGFLGKLDVIRHLPGYWRRIAPEVGAADAVHVRCPANVAMVALAVLGTRRRPSLRWYKYAGDWSGGPDEPLSYRLQRAWLRRFPMIHRGVVTVNGIWRDQPAHVISFDNPCLTEEERQSAARTAEGRQLSSPLRLLFAGRLGGGKRPELAIKVLGDLLDQGVEASLDVVGEGEHRTSLEQTANTLGMGDRVSFHGWLPRHELDARYADAHLLLVPSRTEGFPKVVSEAMAFGTVPVVADLPAVAQVLSATGCGTLVPDADPTTWSRAVRRYVDDATLWELESRHAIDAGHRFTYETYVERIRALLTTASEQHPDRC